LDDQDRKLLKLIQQDGKMSYAELGDRVGLSLSAVNERLKKLSARGVIKKYAALIDPEALGLHVCAFVQVSVDLPKNENGFLARIARIPEVLECHHVTGEFSYLLKVRLRGTAELEQLLKQKLKSVKGVVRTHTVIVLSTVKEETALPVEE
jgi:Lrp/AsnC family transcriptional regulator, leucine-responsive regulatory protein